MFHYDSSLLQLAARPGQLLALAESSNQPQVHVAGRQAQPAQAFVVSLRQGPDTGSVFIYLWLTLARQPAVFVPDERTLPLSSLARVEEEAWNFCESMGFMLDRAQVGSPAEQAELFARLPPFQRPAERASVEPLVSPGPAAAFGTPPPLPTTTPAPPATPGPGAAALTQEELAQLGRLLGGF